MRPKSAVAKGNSRADNLDSSKYEPSNLRTEYLLSYSKKNKANILDRTSLNKIGNVRLVKTVKNIGMIHAYQPQILKQYLVTNNKSYAEFFSRDGHCKSNDIFLKSIISHFREWRKEIQRKQIHIFQLIIDTDELLSPGLEGDVMSILKQLKDYGSKIKQNIEEVIKSGVQSSHIAQLSNKFEMMDESLKHVMNLITNLFNFTKELNQFLTENKDIDINDVKRISLQLDRITQKYQKSMSESFRFCDCHPDNQLLLKMEFKIRQKMLIQKKNAFHIFESMKEMQNFDTVFSSKLAQLLKYEDFSFQYLQSVIEFLYFKNEEIKLNQKKFRLNQQVQFKIQSVREEIEAAQTDFIRKFRLKCLKDVTETVKTLNKLGFLELVKSKGKQYLQTKKKWLLIIKVYQQSEKQSGVNEQKYEKEKRSVQQIIKVFSNAIKTISTPVQQIKQKMEVFESHKQKAAIKNIKLIEKYIQQIKFVEQRQLTVWNTVNSIMQELCKIEQEAQQVITQNLQTDSLMLTSLSSIIVFSKTEELNNEVIKALDSKQIVKSKLKWQSSSDYEEVFNDYEMKLKVHYEFMRNSLEAGLVKSNQLRQINKTELVGYLFGAEFSNEFISHYPTIKNVVLINEKLNNSLEKTTINNVEFSIFSNKLLDEYRNSINKQIKQMQKSKSKSIFNKYIVFLYQSTLIQFMNIKYIYKLYELRNNKNDSNTEQYNAILAAYINIYDLLFSKNKKQNSLFWQLSAQIYDLAQIIFKENKFICEYSSSIKTGQYYPALQLFAEWMELEYTVYIQQLKSNEARALKRQQIKSIFLNSIKKLQALKQKMKLRQLLSQQNYIYRDVSDTLIVLRDFTFEEDYQNTLSKILRYFRIKKIEHSAIFTKDLRPIGFLLYSNLPYEINRYIYYKLHIHHNSLNNYPNLVGQYQYNDKDNKQLFDIRKSQKQIKSKSQSSNKNLAKGTSKKSIEKKQQPKQTEEIISQSISFAEQMQQHLAEINIRISQAAELVHQEVGQNKNANNSNIHQKKGYSYWKIELISNLQTLKKCLLYRNNEFDTIRRQLSLQMLCGITTSEDKQNLIKHLSQLLKEAKESDLMRVMGVDCQRPQCEQILFEFKEALQNNESNLFQKLVRVLDYFNFSRRSIYERGKNKIEIISKQEEDACFVNMELKYNVYKKKLTYFEISGYLQFLWKEVKMTMELGSQELLPNVTAKTRAFVENFNEKLQEIYNTIEKEISVALKVKALNKKSIEEKIKDFMENTIKCKIFLPEPNKLSVPYDAVEYINKLSMDFKKLGVLEQFWTLQYNGSTIYLSEAVATEQQISNCLLVKKIGKEFSGMIEIRDHAGCIKYNYISQRLQTMLVREPISFQNLRIYIFYQGNEQYFEEQKVKRVDLLRIINNYTHFMKLMKDLKYNQILLQTRQLSNQIQLLNYLTAKKDINIKNQLKLFQSNRSIKYIGNVFNLKPVRVINQKQLQNLSKMIKDCKISCSKLLFKNKLIGILETESIEQACKFLSISQSENKNTFFQTKPGEINLNKLSISIINILPKLSEFDSNIFSRIESYMSKTSIEVKTQSSVQTLNCLDLYRGSNRIQVELTWPKESIFLKLYNTEFAISIELTQIQYIYFSELEPMLFQEHFSNKFDEIGFQVLRKHKMIQEGVRDQKFKKDETEQQIKRKQAQRQLQILRYQQQKLRIIFENEKLAKQMGQLDEYRKSREKQLKKSNSNQLIKQQKIKQQIIVNNLSSDLDYSIILSQGHSIMKGQRDLLFPNSLKNEDKRQQSQSLLEYQMTLSEHLADNSETKAAKTLRLENRGKLQKT